MNRPLEHGNWSFADPLGREVALKNALTYDLYGYANSAIRGSSDVPPGNILAFQNKRNTENTGLLCVRPGVFSVIWALRYTTSDEIGLLYPQRPIHSPDVRWKIDTFDRDTGRIVMTSLKDPEVQNTVQFFEMEHFYPKDGEILKFQSDWRTVTKCRDILLWSAAAGFPLGAVGLDITYNTGNTAGELFSASAMAASVFAGVIATGFNLQAESYNRKILDGIAGLTREKRIPMEPYLFG